MRRQLPPLKEVWLLSLSLS